MTIRSELRLMRYGHGARRPWSSPQKSPRTRPVGFCKLSEGATCRFGVGMRISSLEKGFFELGRIEDEMSTMRGGDSLN